MYRNYDCLVGVSLAINRIKEFIYNTAKTDYPVLLLGETGVGKELVARLIHEKSNRNMKSFYAINYANIPENLLESELFGHIKGAFTDARNDRDGLLCEASGGTIFIDEIGDSSPALQAKILRVVDTGEIRKLGDNHISRIDVRFIFATNKNIIEQINKNEFRKDLYYRISVHELLIPPLRERKNDIPIIFKNILTREVKSKNMTKKKICKLYEETPRLIKEIEEYDMPGNVRELENIVARFISSDGRTSVKIENNIKNDNIDKPEEIYSQIKSYGKSFWEIIYKPFMERKLNCREVARIIEIGLNETNGSYKKLVSRLNIDIKDYKKFMDFIRNHKINKS